jgi:prepilin signal peptidase PulO-like enzyme (type II secretory pathway)
MPSQLHILPIPHQLRGDIPLFQPGIIPVLVVAFVTIVAATTDIWKYKVYNWLTFPTLICGLIYWLFAAGLSGVGMSFAGLIVGFGSLVVFYALGGVGAGDVKLLSAIGCLARPALCRERAAGQCFRGRHLCSRPDGYPRRYSENNC